VQIHRARLGALAHRFQQWTNPLKLLTADIAWIGLSWLHPLPLPHAGLADHHFAVFPAISRLKIVNRLLEQLPTIERKELLKLWCDLFDRVPSPAPRRETLIPILAYRIQEKAFGGLKESTVRKLRELADESVASEVSAQKGLRPKIGTRYVREHAGKLHEITVLEAGYEYEGTTYRSLSEIARAITGTKWSGPAFFGLKIRARSAAA
jgi:hypothetical protein